VDLDLDARPRHQVGERLGEDVRALLIQQRRELPARARLFVDPPRLVAPLDLAPDLAIAGAHPHGVHRCPVGEREGVDGLDRVGKGIGEDLGHLHPCNESGDLHVDVGVLEGTAPEALAVGSEGVERAGVGAAVLGGCGGTGREPETEARSHRREAGASHAESGRTTHDRDLPQSPGRRAALGGFCGFSIGLRGAKIGSRAPSTRGATGKALVSPGPSRASPAGPG
jgi:hypothetical protein